MLTSCLVLKGESAMLSLRSLLSIVVYGVITLIFFLLVVFVLNSYGIINVSAVTTDLTVKLSKKSIIEIVAAVILFFILLKGIHVFIWVFGKKLPSWVKVLLTIISISLALFIAIWQIIHPCTDSYSCL
jgi:hypothetical protein